MSHAATVAELRRHIKHPIIDTDAHYNEFQPVFREQFLEAVRSLGGARMHRAMADAEDPVIYLLNRSSPVAQAWGPRNWRTMSDEERKQSGAILPAWGPPHGNMLDRATSYLPRLLHERMAEIGIDYSILYPSTGLFFPHVEPDELRQVACRAYNTVKSEAYREFSDRMTPVAAIPMYTPAEAIAELEYCVSELGGKVAMIGHIARPIPEVHRHHPELYPVAFRIDALALDSDHDYDPFWARCAELKVPLVSHNTSYGLGFRRSPSNYVFNHTGMFAECADILCRALFLGGVTRRFPTLKFQFLE